MNFLNFHILQTLPFSNLNRDDAGSPKSVIYGNTNRARLSSQALKRASRTHFEAVSAADSTSRTKFAGDHLVALARDMVASTGAEITEAMDASIRKASRAETRKLTNGDKADAKKDGHDESADTLVWLAEAELIVLARKIATSVLDDVEGPDFKGWISSATSSLAIAGFGRMFAASPSVQTEAAIQVAHAFTTHAAVTEIDYFTAVDDLREQYTGDMGAGHLDLAEYTSGVFYRYFNIDRTQLAANWSDINEPEAKERLVSLVMSMLLSLPSGKTNATAPWTAPHLIVVQESAWPVSFADAFEAPIAETGSGYDAASRTRFLDYQARAVKSMPEIFGQTVAMDFAADEAATLGQLTDFSADWVLAAAPIRRAPLVSGQDIGDEIGLAAVAMDAPEADGEVA